MKYILFIELNLILLYRYDPQIRPEKKGEQFTLNNTVKGQCVHLSFQQTGHPPPQLLSTSLML